MVGAKIAVLVSGGGTNLQALIDARNSGIIKSGEIALVVSNNENAYALQRAKNNNIATKYIPSKAPDFEEQLKAVLNEYDIDLIVLAGFMTIFDEQVYAAFPNKILNVHPALIPSFCGKGFYGLHVHEAALEKGVKISGATVHIVIPECDAGPIVLQKAVEVKQDDTPETLQLRIMQEAEWKILPEAVRLFCDGKIEVRDNKVYVK